MVFESVLAQVLNRFLGDYVENLDKDQLNVGIWGGNVELKNLVLKQSALDELDLPVQTIYGRIGKLVLKIPWKNLYGSAFVIKVEDIYLLAAPNQEVSYDAAKEEKLENENKKKQIQKVEEAKQLEADKDKPKADYTFVEKLITQIIKNVQLNIKNIHIRYEDKVTNLLDPFALGITLSELDVESTDDTWKPAITQENISKIFKIVQLDGLAVYWNCKSDLYINIPTVDLIQKMTMEIASKNSKPKNYSYILGPITASARLRLNQKPERDQPAYTIPKVHLNLDMEKLFVGITKAQYRDVIALAESMDRMSRGIPYRKFRPTVSSYRGHYKEWWHFAYSSILECEVKRRRKNWDWNNILGHRKLCKEYGELYQKKLHNLADKEDESRINVCEKNLDIFNIVIIRQRIELETKRLEQTQQKAAKKSWLGWMWGSSPSQEQLDISDKTDILKKFEEAMTSDEKERLYKAIDYHENAAPAQYPEAYVDNSCTFLLRTLEFELSDDDSNVKRIIYTELKGVRCRLDTRAAASALKVHVKIDEFTTFGLEQDDFFPTIISSETGAGDSGLLEVTFETNPIEKNCEQRVYVTSKPLKIVYDSQTINRLIDVFKIPEDSSTLNQLSAAADSGLTNIKELSSSGLQHAIDSHARLDLNIDLHAPYIILPYGGKYTDNENILLINLGNVRIFTIDRPDRKDLRQMHSQGMDDKEILKQLIAQSYDHFQLELTDMQILVAQSFEDWKSCIKESKSTDMHLLSPVNLKVDIFKCLITDDPKLPLSKISADLPSITITVSDARLMLLTALATSIPLPNSDVHESDSFARGLRRESSVVMIKYIEMQERAQKTRELLPRKKSLKKEAFTQFTTLEALFVMSEFSVCIKHQDSVESPANDVAFVKLKTLECNLLQQTYNTKINVRLAAIDVQQFRNAEAISLVKTPNWDIDRKYLFDINFVQVDPQSPQLHSVYKSCESNLHLDFATLSVNLHREGLLELMQFATNLQSDMMEIKKSSSSGFDRVGYTRDEEGFVRRLSHISEDMKYGGKHLPAKKKQTKTVVETIKFKLSAHLEELTVQLETEQCPIASCALKGILSDIVIKTDHTQINGKLNQIVIIDLNPETIHNMIISVTGEEALSTRIIMYESEEGSTAERVDMSVDLTMGGLRIVFLNWFVTRFLSFLSAFQTAQAAIIEASQAAAKSAKENMQNVYSKATKIALNIDLKAPDIIVPANSKSYDAVLLDLGRISIVNKFSTLDVKSEAHFPAVIDEMKMALTDFKLSRIKLDTRHEIVKSLTLLEPLSLKFIMKRNLSVSWYRAIPDVDISGNMSSITLLLTQMDYQMIMSVLNGNMSEGQAQEVVPSKTSVVSDTKSQPKTDNVQITSDIDLKRFEAVEPESIPKIYEILKFTFTLEKLVVGLFVGGAQGMSIGSSGTKVEERRGLGRFSLEGISLKGRMMSDNSIVTSFLLVNCLLDDTRPDREGKLNRLIERAQEVNDDGTRSSFSSTPDSVMAPRSMVDVTFQMKDDKMFLDVRVYSFTVILSVDYLMQIADFFSNQQESAGDFAKPRLSVHSVKSVPAKMTLPPVEPKESHITLNLKIEKPDVILVEHMDNIDTKALILNSEVMVKLRIAGSHQVINGTIKDLQLYSCAYNPLKRAQTKGNVLHPVTISLAGSTPADKGLHLELLITDVRLCVSPSTIELLSRISATTTGAGSKSHDETHEIINLLSMWEQKGYEEQEFWFLKGDGAVEVTEDTLIETVIPTKIALQELCILSIPSIVLTMEAGIGSKTLPLLILESSLKGQVRNWSSQLTVDSSLTLQMSCYNSTLALWEPFIEPVEVRKNDKTDYVPWELKLEVTKNEPEELSSPSSDEDRTIEIVQQPVMSIDVISENTLELTVTKTCLDVLNNLGKAFASAMKPDEVTAADASSPYKVVNELGTNVTILTDKGSFVVFENEEAVNVILENQTEVPLQLKALLTEHSSALMVKSVLSTSCLINNFLRVKVDERSCELNLPVTRADKRYFPLNYRGDNNDSWGLISDIKVVHGIMVITLRSILQVFNHFSVAVEVYYMTAKGNELACIGVVQPGGIINLPLHAVYTPTNELFFAVNGYSVTATPFVWKDLQTNLTKTKALHCSPKNIERGSEPFIIQAVGEMEQVYLENSFKHTMSSTCYNIHLRPGVIFKNLLPIEMFCCIENVVEEIIVEAGETLQLPNVEPGKTCLVVRLPNYMDKEWSSRHDVQSQYNEFSVWTFNSYQSAVKMSLNLGMHVTNKGGSIVMTLYCPFWILNKTGLNLSYRNSDDALNVLHHPASFKGPILFSFNVKNFFGKKKASIRIENGVWSDKFSLDVAGSSGVVVCKSNDVIHQIGVNNQLTYNGLTKQITFTPYFVIINNASTAIECQENDRPADHWVKIEPNSCSALWPKSELDDKLLKLRVFGTAEISAPFLYTESHNTLLKLLNKYGGINVDIQITEGSVYITLAPYDLGMAPALIINHTKDTMNFWEKESVQIRKLKSKHCMLYTWENPSGPRILAWEGDNRKEYYEELRQDNAGEYLVAEDYHIYWVSFLNGMQRTLLFTQDPQVAASAQAANLLEVVQQEINVSIHGIGLSMVNNLTRQEIMYMGIASSGVIWQHCKENGKRFKAMPAKESHAIEAAYQRYLLDVINYGDSRSTKTIVDNKTDADFDTGIILKPQKKKIRRRFQTGLWLQMKTSPSLLQLHVKVNRVQIDNQMFDCIFPVVLAPIPPPKSVAADAGIKPFAELSIVQLLIHNSQIKQFKYFKVLIQEFDIKVDLGFINALVDMLQSAEYSEQEEKQLFLADKALVDEPLFSHVSTQSLQEQKSFYDVLHFSPLKMHLSFSMAAGGSTAHNVATPNFLNVLLQGVGVTLTEVQDVVFKLAYFEREFTFLTQKQLMSEATSHYVGQTIKQLYVLVLGLDVIGNPYGLVIGISKGVEDLFYEPFQGAIQGPGEFAEGLALGVRSLFGHTVGGAAGAVSRITGAVGKGIAVLTFDKDYQRKRRDQINKKPATVQEGIARSGKGLVMGVVDGVTGVFTKPISGAKEEGVGGFFKGLGKGAVGLVTRPTAGVVDFASGSLEAVKRVTELGEETTRLRAPRFLHSDGFVRAYNRLEAEGHKLLLDMEKGKFATTDTYVVHYVIIEKKEMLLLTDKRIAYVTHNDIFGGWQVDWSYTWQDLKHPASVVPKGVALPTSDGKKKRMALFGSGDTGKIIVIADAQKREEICEKIESLRTNP